MARLGDFAFVRDNLKQQKKELVAALHKLIFEVDGDRNNRKRLREFEGFSFGEADDAYTKKLEYIKANLTVNDLVAVCSMLCVSYEGDNLGERIVKNLFKGKLLTATDDGVIDDVESQGESEADVDDEINNDEREVTIVQQRMQRNNRWDETSGDDDVTSSDDDETQKSIPTRQRKQNSGRSNSRNSDKYERKRENSMCMHNPKFAMSFRDIEDSVRVFDGNCTLPIGKWIQEFEETACVMHWDDLQKFVFAKKSLKGLAKLFVASEEGITSYKKLKRALIEEFGTQTNSAQLHKILRERRKGKDEGVQEYYLKMKEIASSGSIEESSLMQYVIDGIADLTVNKTILYGAKNLRQFKEKLKDYETMNRNKLKQETLKKTDPKQTDDKSINKSGKKSELKCFNCGERGHKSIDCKNKEKGVKCFGCNKYGHIASDCPNKKSDANVRMVNERSHDIMVMQVCLGTKEWTALLDTGSKCHIVTKRVYDSLNKPELKKSNNKLIGFGKTSVTTMGQFTYQIVINNQSFDLTFHVVPTHYMDIDVIIGKDFSKFANIYITAEKVLIQKIEAEPTETNENYEILKIDVTDEKCCQIGNTASKDARLKVEKLINEYQPMQRKTTNITMRIVLTDETPIFSRPRRLPFRDREIVDQQVEQWLHEGVIEPSNSDFSSPVVLVKKKDGTPRLCVDYRKVNKVITKDRFPLPLIEDQIDRLQNARVFSTIDLKNGFFHVPVDELSRKYTSFVTHSGQYQFSRVPFGLTNSPSVFQRHVNAVFRNLTNEGIALPYIDDVIIPAMNEKQALLHLEKVFKICEEYGLLINFRKCHFLKNKIEFLGYVIEEGKISPSPRKVQVLLSYPVPRNIKHLESFLGLAGYFRKFIPNFSTIAKPLSDLRKKDRRFEISDKEMDAINQLKEALTNEPILRIYNQLYETEVHTDASADGYGAVLLQRNPDDNELHPVYYMSKKTSEAEKKYSSYELEVLAVIEALKKFRVYLLGLSFKLVTDCKAFTKTLEKKELSTRVARWILFLEEYSFKVEHRYGTQMRHVDALSRNAVMSIDEANILTLIRQAQTQDEDLKAIFRILRENTDFENYFLKGDVLYKLVNGYELVVIPKAMQREIIKRTHDKGHFAVKKTKDLICKEYYIPNLDMKIQRCISCCIPCIVLNRKKGKQEGELHPFLKEEIPLHTYHIDFLGPLETTSKLYHHVFVVVDAFTKFCWLYPTKSTSSKDAIVKLEQQRSVFGNPQQIISDRGSAFTSDEFQRYCEAQKIKHFKITTGLPRVNGQVERLNAVISAVLAKASIKDPTKWYRNVEKVQQAINSTHSRSTGMTPFELLIGIKMRNPEDIEIHRLVESELRAQFDEDRKILRQNAKQQILRMQNENRKSFNSKRKKATLYKEGDLVVVKRTQFGGGLKLRPKYLGPYQVVKAKSNDTYDVQKSGIGEGPIKTTTCAEYMKPYVLYSSYSDDDSDEEASESNAPQDGRMWD